MFTDNVACMKHSTGSPYNLHARSNGIVIVAAYRLRKIRLQDLVWRCEFWRRSRRRKSTSVSTRYVLRLGVLHSLVIWSWFHGEKDTFVQTSHAETLTSCGLLFVSLWESAEMECMNTVRSCMQCMYCVRIAQCPKSRESVGVCVQHSATDTEVTRSVRRH